MLTVHVLYQLLNHTSIESLKVFQLWKLKPFFFFLSSLNYKIHQILFQLYMTNSFKDSPTTDLPRVHPQCEFTGQSQISVVNPALPAGPKELWILPMEPVHSDAPAGHRKQKTKFSLNSPNTIWTTQQHCVGRDVIKSECDDLHIFFELFQNEYRSKDKTYKLINHWFLILNLMPATH